MTKHVSLVTTYALFAGLAIGCNLLVQYVVLHGYQGPFNLYLAIGAGTAVGLVVKYWLDKRYIFFYQTNTQLHNLKKFILYTITGVVTTLIFWGAELSFNAWLQFENAKFLGAAIGLLIGYYIKYQLDKKFVFNNKLPINE